MTAHDITQSIDLKGITYNAGVLVIGCGNQPPKKKTTEPILNTMLISNPQLMLLQTDYCVISLTEGESIVISGGSTGTASPAFALA